MREPAVQRSPLSEKIVNSAASSARSRSASSKISTGDLPPSSIDSFLSPAMRHDPLAGHRAAGEGNRAHVGMPDQRLAGVAAVAVHDVEHTRRHAGIERQRAQPVRGQRRKLRHLQHCGVAEREARRDLPRRGHERHVPRRDQRAHADRLDQRVVEHGAIDRIATRRPCASRPPRNRRNSPRRAGSAGARSGGWAARCRRSRATRARARRARSARPAGA